MDDQHRRRRQTSGWMDVGRMRNTRLFENTTTDILIYDHLAELGN